MFVLMLNDMRCAKSEYLTPVARGETVDVLKTWLMQEKAKESYRDGQFHKKFAKGSVLEWYNPPMGNSFVDVGTEDEWVEEVKHRFQNEIMSLLSIGD